LPLWHQTQAQARCLVSLGRIEFSRLAQHGSARAWPSANPQNPTSHCASGSKTCTQVQSFASRSDRENPNRALRKVRRQYSDRSARGSAKTGDTSPTWENAPACYLSLRGRFDTLTIGVEPSFVGHCRSARLYQRRDVASSQQSVGFGLSNAPGLSSPVWW
jgi:hypothetical protein